ncbi:tyrosine-protein phosphatase 10D-like isoform X1 [Palaemon carinicauda]|uniref:tyrosine-protein phosphatase 10D-like isoform X1 n=1 Tax=Palaemon carinicauda TaxID=392227 RepID=UPI0035B586D0
MMKSTAKTITRSAERKRTFSILYQEVETFNGDSKTKVVKDKIDVNELYPGRNYSLSLSAISNGIESELTITSIATKPASPIIEELQPIPAGFIISWKSDVTFRQEKIYSSLY